jgi:transposase
VRFYDAYDARGQRTAREIFKSFQIHHSTGYKLLHDRERHGKLAERRGKLRQHQQRLRETRQGPKPKISDEQLAALVRAPIPQRKRQLEVQAARVGVTACRETIRRALLNRKRAAKFKASKQKAITLSQQEQRRGYCNLYRYKPVQGFWDGVLFTDEAHMALDDFPDEWILRVIGERYHHKNLVSDPNLGHHVVHFAAWINYYEKPGELTFYNDEYDDVEPVKPPPKPRRRPKSETDDEYNDRLRVWEAELARNPIVERPGNSMRASYYTEKILPVYRDALRFLRLESDAIRHHIHPEYRYSWYLVEDNDPSHGTRNPDSLPAVYKAKHGIHRLHHPANSPDLNPIESIWNIIKQRTRHQLHKINSISDLKAHLQFEWSQVSIEMIQKRIDEMPDRIIQAWRWPERRVKTRLW